MFQYIRTNNFLKKNNPPNVTINCNTQGVKSELPDFTQWIQKKKYNFKILTSFFHFNYTRKII